MKVRRMLPTELDAAVSVWREANIARGALYGPERTARIRAKLSASDALPFVALRPGVVGMALAEPGRFDDGAGDPDPSLLHISMVFVHPAAQRTGVGLPLIHHVFDVGASLGYQRVSVWTGEENAPARRLYERAGMTLTGKSAPFLSGTQLQYERPLNRALNADELAAFYANYVDAWNKRDLESYYALYAADLVFRDGSTVLHGIDALRDRYETELREYPDLMMECVRLFVDVESQAIAAENIERGTGIELRGALFLTLGPEGRISEIAEYLATATAAA